MRLPNHEQFQRAVFGPPQQVLHQNLKLIYMESNNKFGKCSKCPAFMDDSRLFTNYLPNSKLNTYITKINNITNNRRYLRNFYNINWSVIQLYKSR